MVKLTDEQKAEIDALENLSDDELDLSDIPEQPIHWATAKIGMHYKPDWQDITLRLDQNVIHWFEEQAETLEKSHQDINKALMDYIRRVRFSVRTDIVKEGMHILAIRDAIKAVISTIEEWDGVGGQWREDQTRYAIIDPILRALGWDTADPKVCHPEWQAKDSKGRVDYALFPRSTTYDFAHREAIPAVIIECKSFRAELWEDPSHQLQAYVDAEPRMTEGMAVLTNGDKWLFYMLGDGHRLYDIEPYAVDLTHYAPDFIAKKFNELMGRQNW